MTSKDIDYMSNDRYFLHVENDWVDARNDQTGGQTGVYGTFELTTSNGHINEGLFNYNMNHNYMHIDHIYLERNTLYQHIYGHMSI